MKTKINDRKFYSLRQAAEFLGIPHGTLKHQVMVQKRMKGMVIGRTTIFSREQLEDYRANDFNTNKVVDVNKVMGTVEAAKYVGLTTRNMAYHADEGNVTVHKFGNIRLFLVSDLNDFRENREGDVSDG